LNFSSFFAGCVALACGICYVPALKAFPALPTSVVSTEEAEEAEDCTHRGSGRRDDCLQEGQNAVV